MKFLTFSSLTLGSCLAVAQAAPYYGTLDPQAAARDQMDRWQQEYGENLETLLAHEEFECTAENIVYREEWRALSEEKRYEYIEAVKCLMSLPSQSSPEEVPGAKIRYDDFVATHILKSTFVHHSGLFLTFHRYYTWLYEKALREECGYTGYQPYWDWSLDWKNFTASPVLDGSPTSMGGNGQAISHGYVNDTGLGFTTLLRPGTGGGCVDSGPFANTTMNLGPVALLQPGPNGGLGYNPRCLHRDISVEWSRNTQPTEVVDLINACDTVECFDITLEGLYGVHAAGHFGVGGIMADQFASPSDPLFWLHHGMVDYLWTLWQSRDFEGRTYQGPGRTETARNTPPSPDATLDSIIDSGILAPKEKLGNLVSTVGGPFCYQYI